MFFKSKILSKRSQIPIVCVLFNIVAVSLVQAVHIDVVSECNEGRIDGCVYDQLYVPLYRSEARDGMTQFEAHSICQSVYGTSLASLSLSRTDRLSIAEQFAAMSTSCKAAGPNQACWTSGLRVRENDVLFSFAIDAENEFVISSDGELNLQQYNTSLFAEGEGSGSNEDCVALYHAKDYLMADWSCSDAQGVSVALCMNPEFDLDAECSCECSKCTVYGGYPHIYTFDDLFYAAFVSLTPLGLANSNSSLT